MGCESSRIDRHSPSLAGVHGQAFHGRSQQEQSGSSSSVPYGSGIAGLAQAGQKRQSPTSSTFMRRL